MILSVFILYFMADIEALVKSKVDIFIFECFEGNPPPPDLLIIEESKREEISRYLFSPDLGEIFTYWAKGSKSAWILNRKGQERMITLGVIIEDFQIKRVEVIQYREERGWEIKTPRFLDQFKGYTFKPEQGGSRRIDSISGATLSVDVVKDSVIIALQLDTLVHPANE